VVLLFPVLVRAGGRHAVPGVAGACERGVVDAVAGLPVVLLAEQGEVVDAGGAGRVIAAAGVLPDIQDDRGGVIGDERVRDVKGPARRSRAGPGVQGVAGMISLSR
jgi:hypothetical protein